MRKMLVFLAVCVGFVLPSPATARRYHHFHLTRIDRFVPILTTPFKTVPPIPFGNLGVNLFYPGVTESTELTIKPSASERWNVGGLSIQLSANYTEEYVIET